MSAVTALGHLRQHARRQDVSVVEAYVIVPHTTADRASHDYEAALQLDGEIAADLYFEEQPRDIRTLLLDLLIRERPGWLSVVQSGRRYVRDLLNDRVQQVFEAAGLFDEVPAAEVVEWWDRLASIGWSELDYARLARGREAERRSLEYEIQRLEAEHCPYRPAWVSLDDNQAGYDIASWLREGDDWDVLPIEVKSTVKNIPEFHLSRAEYKACVTARGSYRFHIWTGSGGPHIADREAVIAGAPRDGTFGEWCDAFFRLPQES